MKTRDTDDFDDAPARADDFTGGNPQSIAELIQPILQRLRQQARCQLTEGEAAAGPVTEVQPGRHTASWSARGLEGCGVARTEEADGNWKGPAPEDAGKSIREETPNEGSPVKHLRPVSDACHAEFHLPSTSRPMPAKPQRQYRTKATSAYPKMASIVLALCEWEAGCARTPSRDRPGLGEHEPQHRVDGAVVAIRLA